MDESDGHQFLQQPQSLPLPLAIEFLGVDDHSRASRRLVFRQSVDPSAIRSRWAAILGVATAGLTPFARAHRPLEQSCVHMRPSE